MKTYKCKNCEGEFVSGWSEQEALEEANQNFPGTKEEELAVVCDYCFKKIMIFHKLSTGEI